MIDQLMIPSRTFFGEGSIEKIREITEAEHTKKALVFTDRGILGAGLAKKLLDELDAAGVPWELFADLSAEPAYTDVERVRSEAERSEGDLIVAIGGGSVLDAAKLCSVLKGSAYSVRSLLEHPEHAKKQLKMVAVPTTCGTGSEATCNAIVAVPEEEVKKGIVTPEMIPDYVILDPQMIAGLPKSIVAATGVDALAHVVECYTSKKATPLSDTYALAGARLIFGSLRRAWAEPADLAAKSCLLLGAFYGGVAITGSGTTAVHALSYPLGGKYHIAHGVSNAILFAHVMEINKDACEERLAELCDAVWPQKAALSAGEKADYVIGEIADIVRFTEIPTDLRAFGVGREDLDFLVDAGSRQTRLLNNNRKRLTLEDIRSIYEKVL